MHLELQIIAAFIVDLFFGDPTWMPHPARLIGALAARLETISRQVIPSLRLAGVATTILTLAVTAGVCLALLHTAGMIHPMARTAVAIYLIYAAIAARDLTRHSLAVCRPLMAGDLPLARQKVSMIVGRDTESLNEEGIARATVESVAENLVDGVTAPLFFAMLAGPLGAMLYRAVNTGDSMFGYKNDRYLKFGWAAARLDDLANFLPARLSGVLVPLAALFLRLDWRNSRRIFWRDRLCHASPNSGHTEAAVAGALNIQLGGANSYFGRIVVKPTIGEAKVAITAGHIITANRLMLMTTALFLVIATMISFLVRG